MGDPRVVVLGCLFQVPGVLENGPVGGRSGRGWTHPHLERNLVPTYPAPRSTTSLVALLAAISTVVAGLVAVVVAPTASAGGAYYLVDASGTIACEIRLADEEYTYTDAIRCDHLGEGTPAPMPSLPSGGCIADWAPVATMSEGGFPAWGACVGDSINGGSALEPGTVITHGAFRCTGLSVGVRCVDPEVRRGFTLTPTSLTYHRPPARPRLSTSGLGKLRLGMTVKRARRTGYLGAEVCGSPQLRRRQGQAYLTWRGGRFDGLLANSHTNLDTTRGVGVGSMLRSVRAEHRGRVVLTRDQVEGQPAYVYVVRGKRGRLVFLLDLPLGHRPSATTAVDALWVTRSFSPKRGFGFSGC
jgi:hypothetical protein